MWCGRVSLFFLFKQKTADDMRISDWSSDVCSSDLFCRSLYEYWLGLPKPRGSLLPLKSALDPTAIPRLLSRVVLHDLRHPGRSILRLVGTGMAEQYGFDPTGRDYLDLVAPDRKSTRLNSSH